MKHTRSPAIATTRPEVSRPRAPSGGTLGEAVLLVEQLLPSAKFVTRQFSSPAGARAYKMYVPASCPGEPMALLVMLHGCKQSPDDFAAGTQMNRLAEQQGFIVVYPEQPANANCLRCWNWFKTQHQVRDGGEPSVIAGITREVATNHAVDRRRIYITGLSAGAAMALILGETYPELYAGIGVHSGLPYAGAHDMPSALAAMAGGRSNVPLWSSLPGTALSARKQATQFVPTSRVSQQIPLLCFEHAEVF